MADNKTVANQASVDEFIASVDNATRRADAQKLLKIYQDITEHPPVMWGPSIIGFGSYHYVYDSGREGDMPLAAFSPRKSNLTIYVGNDFKNAESLFKALGKHKKSKACLYINKLDDIDLSVLKEIIANDFASPNKHC